MKKINLLLLTACIVTGIVSNAFGQTDMLAKLEVNGNTTKDYVEIGMIAGATDGFDNAYDTPALGVGLNPSYVYTYIDHTDWARTETDFRGDLRSLKYQDEWTMSMETNLAAGTVLTMALRKDSVIPAGYALTVEDVETGAVIDPKAGTYQFTVTDPAVVRTFVITAAYTEKPGAPALVSAVAGNAQATVSFNAPTSNGGSDILDYTVTSKPGGKTATGTTSPITVTGLTNGTAYTFTVTARNAVGTGAPSGASNRVTPLAPVLKVPGAPKIGKATAGVRSATVTFTPPVSNGGSPILDYTVTSSPGGVTAKGATSPIVVTGLKGFTYTFTVKARNAVGMGPASAPSNKVTPKK